MFEINKFAQCTLIEQPKLDITKHSRHYHIVRARSYLELRDKWPDAFCIQQTVVGFRALYPNKGKFPNLVTGDIA